MSRSVRTARVWLVACALGICLPGMVRGQGATASERRAVDRAERQRDAGRPEEARGVLREHLDRSPGSLTALEMLRDLSFEAGEAARVLAYCEAALAVAEDRARARGIWVGALMGAGLADSALSVARRWREEQPDSPEARLSVSAALVTLSDTAGAIRELEDASSGADEQILLRLADLLLTRDEPQALVRAWLPLLTADPPRVDAVVADLLSAGPARETLLDRLADALAGAGTSATRAGAFVALRLGRLEHARELAYQARTGGDAEDASFLRDYVREAEGAAHAGEVAWAALELVRLSPRPVDRLRWQALAADQSLVAGDTGSARGAYVALAGESEPGEGPHALATQRLFSLLAADPGALDGARELLVGHAAEYSDSTRARARMFGELALGYARSGDLSRGEAALREARASLPEADMGPVDFAGARLALFAGARDSVAARSARSVFEEGLEADRRTRRLGLLTVGQTADSAEIAIVGRAALGIHASPGGFDAPALIRELAGRPPSPGRAAALAYLADRAAEAGRTDAAAALRRRVIEAYPQSAEAPAALLDLARASVGDEAVTWLERLVVGYPESALAPMARRLLRELRPG